MNIKVVGNELFADRWVYHKPSLKPDENGKLVMLSKYSFAPLEVYEWGITDGGRPYEMYKWCENDFYAGESYTKEIALSELKQKIDDMIVLVSDNGLSDWTRVYEEAKSIISETERH